MTAIAQDLQIEIKGLVTSYIDEGSGQVPIVFVHGFPFDKSVWQYQIDHLKEITRVISYDLRGFGKSQKGTQPLSIELLADDLIALLDSLNINKAVVCGLSMGGYIILNALQRHSDRFEAVILCDTQCMADTEEAKEKRYKAITLIEAGGLDEFADSFVNAIFSKGSLEHENHTVAKVKEIILSTSTETLTDTLKALANRSDTCGVLPDIEVPTLIMCGSEDTVTPPERSEQIQRQVKLPTYHVIQNAGHVSNIEEPEIFNRYIGEFVGKYKLLRNVI